MVLSKDNTLMAREVPPPAAATQGQNRSVPPISHNDVVQTTGILPSLAPRLTSTNIRTLTTYLCNRIISKPSYQLREFGYMGMLEEKMVYALTGAPPRVNYQDPGAVRDPTDV